MSRRSPLRGWLEENERGPASVSAEESVATLEKGMLSCASLASAFDTLASGPLTPDQARRLEAILTATWSNPIRLPTARSCLAAGLVGLTSIFAMGLLVGGILDRDPYTSAIGLGALTGSILMGLGFRFYSWSRRTVQLAAVAALESHGGPASLATLCELLLAGDASHPAPIRHAAIAVMNRIEPGDYANLPRGCEDSLISLLYRQDPGITEASLNALRRAGSGSSARIVGRVVKTGRSESLRRIAAEVELVLLQRQHQEMASSTLLRAAPAIASGDLLRASAEPEARPQELLRSSEAAEPFSSDSNASFLD